MAGAHHSKHSKHGKSSRRKRVERPTDRPRRLLPIIVIVCDDKETAPAYFDLLKRALKQSVTLRIIPAGRSGVTPNGVVHRAIKEYKGLRPRGARDSVWALFDTECLCHVREQAEIAKDQAEKHGKIKTAVSDPCYDLWTLLHLEDTGEHFEDCAAIVRRIESLWQKEFNQPFGPKAQAKYEKIFEKRYAAAERAKRQHNARAQSTTEVYKVIEAIDEACKSNQAK